MTGELVGQMLGNYRIDGLVASRARGAVYDGRHVELDRRAAIKTLSPDAAQHEESVKRFHREGRYIAKFRHDNVANVYELGIDRGIHYMAMDFVEGEPIKAQIEREGGLAPLTALDVTRQVAEALSAAHKQSIIHRDIKPDNIMVDSGGNVKVMDFGIAKDMEDQSMLTQVGMSVGTRYYMSPEQILGTAIDHRTDIYSLGVVLFEMLTGRLPYSETLAFLDLMNKIVQGPFPSPRLVNPEITETVERIVLRMTAVDPAERYDSALDLADDIRYCVRTKQYLPNAEPHAGSIIRLPLKRLFGGATAAPTQAERSKVQRRREDRERVESSETLKKDSERYKDRRHAHRIIVRKNCRALLYENCESVSGIGNAGTPANSRPMDLNNEGLAFLVRKKLERNSRHVIVIQIGDGKQIRTPGQVIWRHQFEKLDAYVTGFLFLEMPAADKERLPAILLELRESAGF